MMDDLIQSLYDGRTSLPKDPDFYTRILEDENFLAILPQVYYLLKQQGRLIQTPPFFRGQLKEKSSETLFKNIFIKNQMAYLLQGFEELGIDVMPLKGALFAEKTFGHLGARATSDIDLLVRLPHLEEAIDCVKSLGFTVEHEWIPSHFHCSFSKPLPDSQIPLTVEIHWDLLKKDTANFDINEFWNQAAPIGSALHIKELSNYHTFYMICLHGWRHNLQSPKYFLDIIQMIDLLHDELDYQALLYDAEAHKTLKRIVRTLSIVYRQYPFLDQTKPFPNKRSTLYWEVNPSRKSLKRYADFIDYQFLSYDSVKHSWVEFLYWVKSDMISMVRSR